VPEGYIAVFSDKLSEATTIAVDEYAADLNFLLETMQAEGADSGPVFHGHVAAASALMGHSTGGGADVLAAAGASLAPATAVVNLAALGQAVSVQSVPVITGTNPYSDASAVTVPVLLLAAAEDCICPIEDHAGLIYDNLTNTERSLVSFVQGDHCGFGQDDGPSFAECAAAEAYECGGMPPGANQGPTMSNSEQLSLTLDVITPWLACQLLGDAAACATYNARIGDLVTAGTVTVSQAE